MTLLQEDSTRLLNTQEQTPICSCMYVCMHDAVCIITDTASEKKGQRKKNMEEKEEKQVYV